MRKAFSALIAIVLLIGLLGLPSALAEDVTLRFMWWGGDARHQATLAVIDRYKELTGVTIQAEYQGWDGYEQKFMTQLAGGTAPDICQIDAPWLLNLVQRKMFVNLKDHPLVDFTQFEPAFIESSCTVLGEVPCLPCGINCFRFFANKDFLDKHAIDIDKTYTWDEFFALGEQIHADNPDEYLLAWDPGEPWQFYDEYIRQKTGLYLLSDDFTVAVGREDIIDGLSMLQKMYDTNTSLPLSEVQPFYAAMDTNPKWIAGQIGGLPDFTSKYVVWEESSDFPVVSMKLPVAADAKGHGATCRPSQFWGVPTCSKNQEEAIKFINWALTDPEAAVLLGTVRSVPAAKSSFDVLAAEGALQPVLVDAIEKGLNDMAPAAPFVMGDAEIGQIMADAYQRVAFGQGSIEDIADELISRLTMRLDEMQAE